MQSSAISRQTYGGSFFTAPDQGSIPRQANHMADMKKTEITVEKESVKISTGHDFTQMNPGEMLDLAKSFYEDGNPQDFLTMAVFSARTALEDHPDPYVAKTWTSPRNEDGTFNLLAELQATPESSTGSSHLDAENRADREHLLNTLLSLPVRTATMEHTSIHITL